MHASENTFFLIIRYIALDLPESDPVCFKLPLTPGSCKEATAILKLFRIYEEGTYEGSLLKGHG